MKRIVALLLLCWIAAAITACNTNDPEILPCNEEGALFRDDFSAERNCGWLTYEQAGGSIVIADGVLTISSNQPNEIRWTNPDREFEDVVIQVQAQQVSGPDDNAFGIICRYQNDQNFYLFLVSGDGYYVIAKYQSGSPVQYISGEGQFQYSDVINQGTALNSLEASCIGNQLSLKVNGIPLSTVTDPTFVRGDIGLGASPFDPGTTVIQFDDILVTAP